MQSAHLVARNSLIIFLMKKSNVFKLNFSWVQRTCSTKCFKKSKKCSSVIHLDGFAPPLLPVGAPLRKCLKKFYSGKNKVRRNKIYEK